MLGYAAGGALPVVPIMLVNVVLGGVAASHAGLSMGWWLWANGVLLTWCLFAWCVAAGGGMMGMVMGTLILGPLVGTFVTGGALTMVVPGLAPMVSPLAGKTIFSAQNIGSEELVRWVISMGLQLPVAWVFVLAGARRYRLGDIPGLTGPLGSVLVLVLALSSIVAIVDPQMIPRHFQRQMSDSDGTPTIGTVIALLLLASLTALWHVSRHAVEFQGRYLGRSLWIRDAGIVLAAVVAAVAFLLVAPFTPPMWSARIIWTLVELLIAVTTALIWARWAVRRTPSAAVWLGVMGAWWVLPLMAGVVLNARYTWEDTASKTAMQVSPLAMVAQIWSKRSDLAVPVSSLAMQLMMPALGAVLLLRGKERVKQLQLERR